MFITYESSQSLAPTTKALMFDWKYLHVESSVLDFWCTLPYDERDVILTVLSCLREVNTEEVKPALELLVATLDGQGFQALLMAGQRTLHTNWHILYLSNEMDRDESLNTLQLRNQNRRWRNCMSSRLNCLIFVVEWTGQQQDVDTQH